MSTFHSNQLCVVFPFDQGKFGADDQMSMIDSHKVLPNAFNAVFEEREARARRLLGETVAEVKRERSSR